MIFFTRLRYLFTAPTELDELIEERAIERIKARNEANRYRLNLCYKHRQEQKHSHYLENNCHHCQLQKHSAWQHNEILQKDKLLQSKHNKGTDL